MRAGLPRHDLSPFGTAAVFVVLIVLVFLASHNIRYTIDSSALDQVTGGSGIGMSIDAITQGNPRRRIGVMSIGILGILGLITTGKYRLRIASPGGYAAILFAAWSAASLLWAVDPQLTFRRLVSFGFLAVGAIGFLRWIPVRAVPWFLGLSSLAFAAVGLGAEVVFGTFAPLSGGYRFAGTLNANSQGVNCALLLLAGIWISTERSSRYRWLGVLFAASGLILLLATRSRTAVATAFAAALVLIFLRFRPGNKFLYLTVGINVGVLVLFLGVNGWFNVPAEVFLLGRGQEGGVTTLNSRVPLWVLLFDYIAQRPLTGFGFSGFMSADHAAEIGALFLFGVSGSHSLYVELLLGVGAIGLTLFLAGFVAGLVRALSETAGANADSVMALFGAILTFEMLSGILESTLVFPAWRFPSLLVLVAVCVIQVPRIRQEVTQPGNRWSQIASP